jgi:GNAT superfamily N-acetyltransferase
VEPPYRIGPWDRQAGRDDFACGKPDLDAYWRTMAVRHAREGLAAVTVMQDEATGEVIGFYTLVGYTLVVETLPAHLNRRKLPNRLPTTLLGKLAIRSDRQGRGLGSILLAHAVETAVQASRRVASYAVVVDAIDDDAARFYQAFGFRPLTGQPTRLLLTMAEARANLTEE